MTTSGTLTLSGASAGGTTPVSTLALLGCG
jgi:hypothetical protein